MGRNYRKTLCNMRAGTLNILMPEVYRMLDSGKTVRETADAFAVSPASLYRLHDKYQKSISGNSVTDILNAIYRKHDSDNSYAGRSSLANKKRASKPVDMEKVYQMIDEGNTAKSVAAAFHVSVSTLKRRHKEYQQLLRGEEDEG